MVLLKRVMLLSIPSLQTKMGQNTQSIGPFSFHVVEWERAQSVELGSQEDGLVVLNVTSDQGDSTPKLGLRLPIC